jgi:hypothetical protein
LGALGFTGSWFLSRYLASRLALNISVVTQTDVPQVQSAEVIAHLSQLGAAPPKGLEVSTSTDVTALTDMLSPALPDNAAAKIIVSVLQGFIGLTPWHVTVTPISTTKATVAITRNGRAIRAQEVDVVALEIPQTGPNSHLSKLSAALILVTLASHHSGFEALCGATKWDSVGRQYIASTDFSKEEQKGQREQLLKRAAGADRNNLPARVALRHSQHRYATDASELVMYLRWLRLQSRKIRQFERTSGTTASGYTDLHRRILLTYFAGLRNLVATAGAVEAQGFIPNSRRKRLAARLVALLEDEQSPELRDLMRLQTKFLLDGFAITESTRCIMGKWLLDEDLASESPRLAYNVACTQVRNLNGEPPGDEIFNLLDLSFVDNDLRAWARKDPELRTLLKNTRFRRLVGKLPRASFWEIEPFTSHEAKLKAAGVSSPSGVTNAFDAESLATYLGVQQPIAEHLLHVSFLVRAAVVVPLPGAEDIRVELVDQLVTRGVNVPRDIAWTLVSPAGEPLVAAISDAVKARTECEVDDNAIRRWLRRVRRYPPNQSSERYLPAG